jgi:hypothetical protein
VTRTIVITQPMYLPWRGIFEQMRLADEIVYYDDVQLPRGKGFNTRVQIKTPQGWSWLTIPVRRESERLQRIDQTRFVDQTWRKKHLRAIELAYRRAPFFEQVWSELIVPIFEIETELLSELCIESMQRIATYLGIAREVHRSSAIATPEDADATDRLIAICAQLGGTDYVSGKGGMNYIRHERFEVAAIRVRYMEYRLTPYVQLHGPFNPYVSIVDAIVHLGPRAAETLDSEARYWRDWPELAASSQT